MTCNSLRLYSLDSEINSLTSLAINSVTKANLFRYLGPSAHHHLQPFEIVRRFNTFCSNTNTRALFQRKKRHKTFLTRWNTLNNDFSQIILRHAYSLLFSVSISYRVKCIDGVSCCWITISSINVRTNIFKCIGRVSCCWVIVSSINFQTNIFKHIIGWSINR